MDTQPQCWLWSRPGLVGCESGVLVVTLCVALPVNHACLAQQWGADEPLLIKAWAACHQLIWWSEGERECHQLLCSLWTLWFQPVCVCVCVHMSVCVCVTEKEVKKGFQLKIIGINFINTVPQGKYIQSGRIINLCSTSHHGWPAASGMERGLEGCKMSKDKEN